MANNVYIKKIIALLFAISMLLVASSCTSKSDTNESIGESIISSENTSEKEDPVTQAKAKLDKTDFGGVVYVEINGEPYMTYAAGTLDSGEQITVDTSMPIGSVSKVQSQILCKHQNRCKIKIKIYSGGSGFVRCRLFA